ncbi:hypothetical protein GHT06_019932 [Daphnia sinensis]|uniref:CUB domain-containing protein n=1 Tax=Daphnia sinensis TaxID=1820382 RepID=A0AAD5KKR6_9CRUS|nr:hypothetical protein GHT06_019932 [Daphnia sinensis]
MRLLVLCALIAFVSCASAGVVSDRLKATMNKYQKIELTIPESRPISSKGIMQNIQNAIGNRHVTFKIPAIPFVSNLWRSRNSTGNAAIAKNATALSNAEGQQQEIGVSSIISTSTAVPTKPGGHPDWCGGNILLDLNSRRELTYKSTQFPSARSVPYACSWDVKVSKNCRRGRVTMRMDGRSRLAQEDRCSKGYYRVSPFMKEAKICGRIGTVPSFQWYVDDKQPEDVTIIMKNIGLNDGNSEGLSFTLSGECLSKDGETKNKTRDVAMDNMETHSRWMYRLLMDSTTPGSRQSQVVLHTASMSLQPNSKLSAKASEKISQDFGQALASQPDLTPAESSTTSKPANKITFYSPLYLIFRKFNLI